MVVKFDLKSIPAGAKIKDAKLSVYVFANYYEGTNGAKSLFRLTKSWVGSTVTWSTPWTTKGGDFSTPAVATSSSTSINAWEDYNVTAAIKDMVESSGANNGFLFKFDSMTPKKGACIRSAEASQTTQRPKLTIIYEILDTQQPAVTVTYPTSGIKLMQGASCNITWTATDNVSVVSRSIYFDSGLRAWTLLDSTAGNTGTYSWKVPNIVSATCKIKIYAYDAAGNVGSKESGIFEIEQPSGIIPNQFVNSDITGACKVTINNIQGRQIASLNIQNVDQLHQIKAKLSSGVHIVNINTPDKKSIRKVWVIQ